MDRIVLAYSGSLEGSAAISWLAGKYRAEIVTLTIDLGQGPGLDEIRERALAIGAVRAHVIDAREEFALRFVLPALQAGALGHGPEPLATALARPVIARKLLEIARIEGAKAIAHGDRLPGSTPTALDRSLRALDPAIKVIGLAHAWDLRPTELVPYAKERGIPIPAGTDRSSRTDVNLWGRSMECGWLADASQEIPEDVYVTTKSPAEAPDRPAYVEIEFERGVPVQLNGIAMSLVELISCLDTIAGAHGVGRGDRANPGGVGGASREVFEAPAAIALHAAHQDLQQFVTPSDLTRLATELGSKYAELIRAGQWDTPEREAIDAFVAHVQQKVNGTVRLKLYKGNGRVAGRAAAEGASHKAEARGRKANQLASR